MEPMVSLVYFYFVQTVKLIELADLDTLRCLSGS